MKETSNYFKLFSDASFKLELRVQPEQRYKKIVDFPHFPHTNNPMLS